MRVGTSQRGTGWLLGVVLLLTLLGGGCRDNDDDDRDGLPARVDRTGTVHLSDAERKALGLRTEVAGEAELGQVALRFGRLHARPEDLGLVIAEVAGRLGRVPRAVLGDSVEAGAIVAELEPVLATAERVSAHVRGAELSGQIEALSRELATRSSELARAEQLATSQIVSVAKVQEARAAVAAARAQLDALRNARGIQTRAEALPLALTSPIRGTVASYEVTPGAFVDAGTLIARVLQKGPLQVELDAAAEDAVGDRHFVEVSGAWRPARLLAPARSLSADGFRHDQLELLDAEDVALVPGAVVRVRVGHDTVRGVVIDEAALVPGASDDSVFVETTHGSFVRREVKIAVRSDGHARIASGLKAGETVVVSGAQALRGETLRAWLKEQD